MFVSFCTSKVNDVGREESTSSSSILYKYVAIKLMICCIITQQVYPHGYAASMYIAQYISICNDIWSLYQFFMKNLNRDFALSYFNLSTIT